MSLFDSVRKFEREKLLDEIFYIPPPKTGPYAVTQPKARPQQTETTFHISLEFKHVVSSEA